MIFFVKYTLRFLLLAVLLVFLCEIGVANYKYFTAHPDEPLVDILKDSLKTSIDTVNHTIELIH